MQVCCYNGITTGCIHGVIWITPRTSLTHVIILVEAIIVVLREQNPVSPWAQLIPNMEFLKAEKSDPINTFLILQNTVLITCNQSLLG